jgi:hypothetical protein
VRENVVRRHVVAQREANFVVRDSRQDAGARQRRVEVKRDVDVDVPLTERPSERLPVLLAPADSKDEVVSKIVSQGRSSPWSDGRTLLVRRGPRRPSTSGARLRQAG